MEGSVGLRGSPSDNDKPSIREMQRCYELLEATSRSFYPSIMGIEALPERNAMCLFYLALRALDTIEDDPVLKVDDKTARLRAFDEKGFAVVDESCCQGSSRYAELMREFDGSVLGQLETLPESVQVLIFGVARDMGKDMARCLEKDIVTWEDYSGYCWAVAGRLVRPIGTLFSLYEGGEHEEETLDAAGEILQRINIIRDIREDTLEGRRFWPKVALEARGFESHEALLDPSRIADASLVLKDMVDEAVALVEKTGLERFAGIYAMHPMAQRMAHKWLTVTFAHFPLFRSEDAAHELFADGGKLKVNRDVVNQCVGIAGDEAAVLDFFQRVL